MVSSHPKLPSIALSDPHFWYKRLKGIKNLNAKVKFGVQEREIVRFLKRGWKLEHYHMIPLRSLIRGKTPRKKARCFVVKGEFSKRVSERGFNTLQEREDITCVASYADHSVWELGKDKTEDWYRVWDYFGGKPDGEGRDVQRSRRQVNDYAGSVRSWDHKFP